MAGLYLPVSERAKALHGVKPVELVLSPVEEADELGGGHLEIVPRDFEVLSNNFAAAPQGKTVALALTVENEAALVQGGHIKRVDAASAKKKG